MPQRNVITGRSLEPRQRFAQELKLLRTKKGETLRQLSEVLGWDASLFHKMETGECLGGPEVVEALDQHYGTPGLLLALWELAVADTRQFKEQYRRYMALERQASSLWHFAVSYVPGLLQTEGYARAVIASGGAAGEELNKQVQARITRHEWLEGKDAPHFRAVISEAALRTAPRDAQAWHAQVEHLIKATDQPTITIQVLPFSAGPYGLDGTDVMFLRMAEGRTVAYTENAYRGELVQENRSVERLQLAYDAVRDLALSPTESRNLIVKTLEEVPCDAST
ncbi:helix-turn-helix domain-containing protein [Streptomyces sp. MAR4 CNY-716]